MRVLRIMDNGRYRVFPRQITSHTRRRRVLNTFLSTARFKFYKLLKAGAK